MVRWGSGSERFCLTGFLTLLCNQPAVSMSVAMQHPPLLSRQFRSVAGSPDYGEKKPSSPGQSSGESEGNFGALLSLMRVSCSSLCSPRPVPCGQSPVSHEEKLARHSFHVWSLDFGIMTDKTWQAKALVQVGLRHACLLLHLQLLLRLPIAPDRLHRR